MELDKEPSWWNLLSLTAEEATQRLQVLQGMQKAVSQAQQVLLQGGRGAGRKALETLPEELQTLWQQHQRDGENIYCVDRFLVLEAQPWLLEQCELVKHREELRQQALGNAVATLPFESLARYEAHLDRKFEKVLTMIIKLKEMKSGKQLTPGTAGDTEVPPPVPSFPNNKRMGE